MKDRYFIILFSGINEDNIFRNGKLEYATHDGTYPSEQVLIQMVQKAFGLHTVFIKPPHEMAEQDFKDFTAGRNMPPELGEGNNDESFL